MDPTYLTGMKYICKCCVKLLPQRRKKNCPTCGVSYGHAFMLYWIYTHKNKPQQFYSLIKMQISRGTNKLDTFNLTQLTIKTKSGKFLHNYAQLELSLKWPSNLK